MRVSTYKYYLQSFPLQFHHVTTLPPLVALSSSSLRLAYKDLEQQRKKEEQKLKGLEGKKKEQAERLGMGVGMRRYSSKHLSACSRCWVTSHSSLFRSLQRSFSLGDVRHAHHPAGESTRSQDDQKPALPYGGRG